MDPNKQQIAIAEACGWVRGRKVCEGEWVWRNPDGGLRGQVCIPDYLHDLNAMHEVENQLIAHNQWRDYKNNLWGILLRKDPWPGCNFEGDDIAHATAAQRAEAFLRTIGKWEEHD